MDKICDACEFLKSPTNQIITTNSWTVGIYNDQPYLGRAYCTLRTHKGKIGDLSTEEWQDFREIIAKLEVMYNKAFGADVLNIECNMNHAFKTEPFNPHVHWHIYPRYKNSVEIGGIIFDDPLFGKHIDEDLVRMVSDAVVEQIVTKLKNKLT
jgi:diadenosine tetraphosphate (Ap4A) HIT family hydrolase